MREQESVGDAWGDDISDERKAHLEQRLQAWEQEADHGERKGPFQSVELTGADVFWLAARTLAGASEPQAVVLAAWTDLQSRLLPVGRDLSSLNLSGANLFRANLSGANLLFANLSSAYLTGANLSNAYLLEANLSGANLFRANLSGIDLGRANLSGTYLRHADLSSARLFRANLSDAHLSGARLSVETDLTDATISVTLRVADVIWNGVPLARVAWDALPVVGDEIVARRRRHSNGKKKDAATRRDEYEAAVRAYRLLAVTLRSQGLNEHADRYSYRAQLMQRVVLRRQAFLREKGKRVRLGERLHKISAYLGSGLLDLVAGYGYRPGRSILAYIVIICAFAGLYLLNGQFASPHLRWDEALVLSISSFHGRGFFTSGVSLGDTLARLAAGEAIVGLLLEITFIATFTQRFFAR